jgi:hypothetical protein
MSNEHFHVDMLCVMTQLGFFQRMENRYQMTLPPSVPDAAMVRQAFLDLLATAGDDGSLHPGKLLVFMERPEIEFWQERLARMNEVARLKARRRPGH